MREEVIQLLITEAVKARQMAYAPYSEYLVGAALVVPSGKIYTGCNVENASYGLTNCAERTAVFKAVSEGQLEFDAIAVVGGMEDAEELDYCAPCGVCRQVLREFCDNDFEIILAKDVEHRKTLTLKEILPLGFGPENLR